MNEKKSMFTVRNIVRALSMLCIAFVFCPTFLVSCSGQKMEISAMDIATGISVYGQKSDSYPALFICLLLPAVVFAVMLMKNIAAKKAALIVLACSGIDAAIWMFVKSAIKEAADQYYCTCETTGWYAANMIALILMILTACLVLIGKVHLDADVSGTGSSAGTKKAWNQMSSAVNQMSSVVTKVAGDVAGNIGNKVARENAIGFCSKCGSPIAYGNRFCTSCGAPVPENMLKEAEMARMASAEAAVTAETSAESQKEAEKTGD